MRAALALDLGGTMLRAALVGADGRFLARAAEPTLARAGPAAVIAQMAALLEGVAARAEGAAIVGIGVGAPGPLDPERGMVLHAPTLTGWTGVPLAALLGERLRLPVRLENDANAAALGEYLFGAGRGCRHMVFATISTGIGGGVIADGRLLRGRRGMAAEIGHMAITAEPVACPRGGTGCFEALASGTALAQEARAALRAGAPSTLPPDPAARDVAQAAAAGDALAVRLMAREAHWLGRGFANLLHLFSPEVLVMGGGVSAALEWLRPGIEQALQAQAMPAYRDVKLLAAALGDDSGLAGAAGLVLEARSPPAALVPLPSMPGSC